ncbi:MAG: APC family permease [Acidobacteriia bacterium]|nr:APC family permease [Terriglobia bacterium]
MHQEPTFRTALGLGDLVLFNISAVAGVRALAAAAHSGPGSVSLWILAAVLFFIPSAMVVSRLSRTMPGQGGIYLWTRDSLGDWHGFLCAWCYWMNNLFYFPSLTLATVTMGLYIFPESFQKLESNQGFAVTASLIIIWVFTLANVAGLNVGKWIGNLGGACTYASGALLIVLAVLVFSRSGSSTPMDFLPRWDWDKLNFWPQIAFAFGGLELGAILGGEIRDPSRTIRKAAWISGAAIAVFYVAGTIAILVILTPSQVSVVNGLTQAGHAASQQLRIGGISTLLALLVTVGLAGQLGTWMTGSSRLPMVLGADRWLPESMARLHPVWKTPHVALLLQAAACSAFLLAMQLGENLRTGYQLLVDMAVITYFIPFLYLFLAGWRAGMRLGAACGLLVTILAITLSFIPPDGVASPWLFEAKLVGGTALLVYLARAWFRHRAGVAIV